MRIEVIDNHSVATDLLRGGAILDAGARGFRFSRWFAERGHKVYAFDPAKDIENLRIPNVGFYRMGVVGAGKPGNWHFVQCDDPEASYLERGEADHFVATTDIRGIMSFCRIQMFDLVKLNVEGAEYEILESWPGPVARQVVVSFHEHTGRGRGRDGCDRLIERMSNWYRPIVHQWERRYCCSDNYWDTLLVLKESPQDTKPSLSTNTGTITNTTLAKPTPIPYGWPGDPLPSASVPTVTPHFAEIPK